MDWREHQDAVLAAMIARPRSRRDVAAILGGAYDAPREIDPLVGALLQNELRSRDQQREAALARMTAEEEFQRQMMAQREQAEASMRAAEIGFRRQAGAEQSRFDQALRAQREQVGEQRSYEDRRRREGLEAQRLDAERARLAETDAQIAALQAQGEDIPPQLAATRGFLRRRIGEPDEPIPAAPPRRGLPPSMLRQAAAQALATEGPEAAERILSGKPTQSQELSQAEQRAALNTKRKELLKAAAEELDRSGPTLEFKGTPWGEPASPLERGYWSSTHDRALERARLLQQRRPELFAFGITPEEVVTAYREID